MEDKLQAYNIFEILELALLNHDDNHQLISSSHGLYEILLLIQSHKFFTKRYLTPHRATKRT
jgi:hypothetical protein